MGSILSKDKFREGWEFLFVHLIKAANIKVSTLVNEVCKISSCGQTMLIR